MKKDQVFWVTPADGVLEEIDDLEHKYDNHSFIEEINFDDSSMSKLMSSKYPSETIVTLKSEPPSYWKKWVKTPIQTPLIEEIIKPEEIEEIPPGERLYVTRNDVSKRTRLIMGKSHMRVTTKGVESQGIPDTTSDAFASLVNMCYFMIEKNTIANMKDNNSKLSNDRIRRYSTIMDTVSRRENVLSTSLMSAYTDPSSTMMDRTYFLAALYGVSTVNAMVNDLYYRNYYKQVESITQLWDSLK